MNRRSLLKRLCLAPAAVVAAKTITTLETSVVAAPAAVLPSVPSAAATGTPDPGGIFHAYVKGATAKDFSEPANGASKEELQALVPKSNMPDRYDLRPDYWYAEWRMGEYARYNQRGDHSDGHLRIQFFNWDRPTRSHLDSIHVAEVQITNTYNGFRTRHAVRPYWRSPDEHMLEYMKDEHYRMWREHERDRLPSGRGYWPPPWTDEKL